MISRTSRKGSLRNQELGRLLVALYLLKSLPCIYVSYLLIIIRIGLTIKLGSTLSAIRKHGFTQESRSYYRQ